ncbi:MAG: nitrilase-related carbon-nitrogen hydrolase [Pseudomonadota bacterium]|nr:nitrilase-related carbon-nitrogen hydrolase [Pseudomonadota bacterium]
MKIKAGFVQFNPEFGAVEENLSRAWALLAAVDAQLVVLPEFFNTGYLIASREEAWRLGEEIPHGRTTVALAEMAREKNLHVVAGLMEKCDDRLYNAAVLISPGGYVAKYRKIHLFNEEKLWFTPGDLGFAVHDLDIGRIGIMICFDWFFPESMRVLALQGADVICHPANLVLPFCQEAMITRCLENRVYAITANRTGTETRAGKSFRYTGRSQIVAPGAQVLLQASEEAEEIGAAELDLAVVRDKRINPYNDLFADRRTGHYARILS